MWWVVRFQAASDPALGPSCLTEDGAFDGAVFGFEGVVGLEESLDLVDGVHDGAVVTSAELAPDFRERQVRVGAREVHGEVARVCDGAVPAWPGEVFDLDVVGVGDGFEDAVGADLCVLLADDALELFTGELKGDGALVE